MNFETAINRLQEICNKLKDESTPLEELSELYKEGVKISNECKAVLDGISQDIEIEYKKVN